MSHDAVYWSGRNPAMYGDLSAATFLSAGVVKSLVNLTRVNQVSAFSKTAFVLKPLAIFAPFALASVIEGRILACETSAGIKTGLSMVNLGGVGCLGTLLVYHCEKVIWGGVRIESAKGILENFNFIAGDLAAFYAGIAILGIVVVGISYLVENSVGGR